ncbi:MAG: AraC family transcriptional regulator, partial [Muribaculaceae bacterium]|nr:AraC family transcriptional regulator [Muribaculaceae bacterium]
AQKSKATDKILEVLQKAILHGNKDYEIKMLYKLAVIYDELGIIDSVEKYYPRYLKLRAEMRTEAGYGEVEKLDFLAEIERTNKELESLSIRHQKAQRNFMITVSALIIVAIILLALVFVYINLKRTHRNLFARNEEVLKREAQHKLMREEWDKDRALLEQKIIELSAERKSEIDIATPDKTLATDIDEEPDETDRELQMRLYTRILRVMEENSVIFQPGFSMSDLAGLLHVTPRAVSRAINICHNSNFHQLLNEYRIREVTRLMHDPKTEGLTIEAIAECAGFRSRTAFSRLFKKIIGLTPSEYIKMAQKNTE